ncbi:heterokaryon incompatibility protein-domain-containing protein [Hypoxylon cercidicola]|nr:heterokaryon incompatibility protein-domain-containing protein [Hypoxylon cercidicola]
MPMSPTPDERSVRFSHEPLQGARDIRLVRILPRTDNRYGFELELSTISLDNPIPYVALSYTWDAAEMDPKTGDVEPTSEFEVECHGGHITVAENLLDFLHHARRNANTSEKYYWIDQICINQNDLTERSSQVTMMGAIYKAARNVYVWLGKNNPSPEFLWVCKSFIPLILQLDRELRDRGITLRSNSWNCSTLELRRGLGIDVCVRWRDSYREFFTFFYTRCWFHRAWVLQEVTLQDSSRVQVLCGEEEIRWEVLDSFARFVTRSSWNQCLPLLYFRWSEKYVSPATPLDNFVSSRRYIDLQTRGGRELEDWKANFVWDIGPQDEYQLWYSILLHFLKATRLMSAKDPKDHIYSLLGIMAEFLPPGMKCPFTPDYQAATVDVFTDVAVQIFKNTPSLDLLSTISYVIRNDDQGGTVAWPSWVPDFSNDISFSQSAATAVYLVSNGNQCYNASKIDTIDYKPPTVQDGVLTVDGVQIGTIGKCNVRRPVFSGSANLPFLNFILDLCVRGETKYPGSCHTWIEAVWRTLMYDCIPPDLVGKPAVLFRSWLMEHIVRALKARWSKHDEQSFRQGVSIMTGLLRRISDEPSLFLALPTSEEVRYRTSISIDWDKLEEHPFELLPCMSASATRLFLTTNGYLGFGKFSISEGDEIWLLKGGKMPFTLRKVATNQYRLIGTNYLHGAMYGELMTDELVSQIRPVEII